MEEALNDVLYEIKRRKKINQERLAAANNFTDQVKHNSIDTEYAMLEEWIETYKKNKLA